MKQKRTDLLEQAAAIRAAMDSAGLLLTDEQAATVPRLFHMWKADIDVAVGDRLFYEVDGKLYKCLQAHTTQSDWVPNLTASLWAVIDVAHAGTIDDPIPASRGMEYEYGLYYLDPEDGKTYLCERSGATGTVVLQYLPHELVGNYFTEVV